jgi:hypothetical protein
VAEKGKTPIFSRKEKKNYFTEAPGPGILIRLVNDKNKNWWFYLRTRVTREQYSLCFPKLVKFYNRDSIRTQARTVDVNYFSLRFKETHS